MTVTLLFEAGTPARATQYTFTKIATRADGFTGFVSDDDALGDDGTVAFYGEGKPGTRYFAGDGVTLKPINFPHGGGGAVWRATINSAGQLAGTTQPLNGQVGVYRANADGSVTQLDLKPGSDLGAPDINNLGQVAYGRTIDPGLVQILVTDGATTTIIANNTITPGLSSFYAPSLNNKGQVAFSSSAGILVGRGGETKVADYTLIANNSGDLYPSGPPSLNDVGLVAFRGGGSGNGGKAILTGDGGALHVVADDSGPFAVFGHPAINNQGTVVFKGALDDGTEGIYEGPNPVTDRVIGSGDLLFGSVVSALRFGRNSLNNNGEVAFWALMTDGTEGVFRATPIAVPEPSTLALSLLGFVAVGLAARCKRR